MSYATEVQVIHQYYGEVTLLRTVSDTESLVRLASGVEQIVTTDFLKLKE